MLTRQTASTVPIYGACKPMCRGFEFNILRLALANPTEQLDHEIIGFRGHLDRADRQLCWLGSER
ncbi:hypothetical protein ABIC10_001017 [Bradyrhizobium sp. S3.2.12]